jgi:hypothetical protein
MEEILQWNAYQVRSFFEEQGVILQEWEKVQADTLSFVGASAEKASSL